LVSDEPTTELDLNFAVLEAGTDEGQAPVRSAHAAVELLAVLARQCAGDRKFFATQQALTIWIRRGDPLPASFHS
jgi:hypothetical protein